MNTKSEDRTVNARNYIVGTLFIGGIYVISWTAMDVGWSIITGDLATGPVMEWLPVRIAGGLLLGGVLGPIADTVPGSRHRHLLIWWLLVFLSTVGVIIEGRVFAPNLVPMEAIPWDVASQAIVAASVAAGLAYLYGASTAQGPMVPDLPAGRRLIIGLLAGTVTYSVLYFTTGALNYALVTGPYYEQNVEGLVTPPLRVIFVVFLVRGALLSVSLVPLVRTVENPRQRAWISAVSVATLAGFLPLLIQVGHLPLIVLVASSYEILFQVGPAAIVVAALLGKDAAPSFRAELKRIWEGTTVK